MLVWGGAAAVVLAGVVWFVGFRGSQDAGPTQRHVQNTPSEQSRVSQDQDSASQNVQPNGSPNGGPRVDAGPDKQVSPNPAPAPSPAPTPPDPQQAQVTECDRLAMSPMDPDRLPGVEGVVDIKNIDGAGAVTACRKAAEEKPKDRRLWFQLGRAYRASQDGRSAADAYKKAEELGSAMAAYGLALIYRYGAPGVYRDLTEAQRHAQIAHERGLLLGTVEYAGLIENKSPDQARKLYEQAVAAGNPQAMFWLALAVRDGRGGPADPARARDLLRRSFDAGEVRAMVELAAMTEAGRGTTKDEKEARRLYLAAAEKGSTAAMARLGTLYALGIGGDKNAAEARRWWEAASERGDAAARRELAAGWRQGFFGERNMQRSLELLRSAADAGSGAAMVDLGTAYMYGELGMERDLQQARQWFERGANVGHPAAARNLGIIYRVGLGVPVDYQKAWQYFQIAARSNDALAISNLGVMSHAGLGVAKDYREARKFYQQAVTLGNADAVYLLALLDDAVDSTARDPKAAAAGVLQALRQGSAEARKVLLGDPEKSLSEELIAEIQRALGREGLYYGLIEPRLSSAAKEAIQKWAGAR